MKHYVLVGEHIKNIKTKKKKIKKEKGERIMNENQSQVKETKQGVKVTSKKRKVNPINKQMGLLADFLEKMGYDNISKNIKSTSKNAIFLKKRKNTVEIMKDINGKTFSVYYTYDVGNVEIKATFYKVETEKQATNRLANYTKSLDFIQNSEEEIAEFLRG